MTLVVEQEEAIGIIRDLKIIPIDEDVRIEIDENEKLVVRRYQVDGSDSKYPTMDRLTVKYKVNRYTEKIKDYVVCLTNGLGDIVYLIKYSPEVINTLFNNVILLEMSNWRRAAKGLKPLKSIDDYTSYRFEVNEKCNKKLVRLLRKIIEKNTCKFNNEYKNTNEIIPAVVWQNQLAELV